MLNTNGIRIAEDEEFAGQLQQFIGGFEVIFNLMVLRKYLQYFKRQKSITS
jgi:hypothetical protein